MINADDLLEELQENWEDITEYIVEIPNHNFCIEIVANNMITEVFMINGNQTNIKAIYENLDDVVKYILNNII